MNDNLRQIIAISEIPVRIGSVGYVAQDGNALHRNEFEIGTVIENRSAERTAYHNAVFIRLVVSVIFIDEFGHAFGQENSLYRFICRKRAVTHIFNGSLAVFAVVVFGQNIEVFAVETRVRADYEIAIVLFVVTVRDFFSLLHTANAARAVYHIMVVKIIFVGVFFIANRASEFYFARLYAGVFFDYGRLIFVRKFDRSGKPVDIVVIGFARQSLNRENRFVFIFKVIRYAFGVK